MYKNTKWVKELEWIKQLERDGHSQKEIADHYGVSKQQISLIFRKFDIKREGKEIQRNKLAQRYKMKWGTKEQLAYQEKRIKFTSKRAYAKKKGLDFTIEFGELEWPNVCPILGIPIDYLQVERSENSPSFDRLDNTKGYIKDNVRIISWRANRIKNDGTAHEHKLIYEYLTKTLKL